MTRPRQAWRYTIPGLIAVVILAAFFNPPDPSVSFDDFEIVARLIDGDTIAMQSGERIRLMHEQGSGLYFSFGVSKVTRGQIRF